MLVAGLVQCIVMQNSSNQLKNKIKERRAKLPITRSWKARFESWRIQVSKDRLITSIVRIIGSRANLIGRIGRKGSFSVSSSSLVSSNVDSLSFGWILWLVSFIPTSFNLELSSVLCCPIRLPILLILGLSSLFATLERGKTKRCLHSYTNWVGFWVDSHHSFSLD